MKTQKHSKHDLRIGAKEELFRFFSSRDKVYERQNKIISEIEMNSDFKKAKNILIYYPLADEFDLSSLIISNPHKNWILPRVIGKGIMLLFAIDELHLLIDSKFGKVPSATNKLFKPSELDMVIIPGLAFDKKGYRLGRGLAYYDRLLSKLNNKTYTVGVIIKELIYDSLPIEEHDKSVRKVIAV
jgi:5-formyltetrahydrofolate cyclo-ligase